MEMIMILISLSFTTFLAFLFLKLLFKRTTTTTTTTTTKLNLPPSPWGLPFIGNFHQLGLHTHRALHALSLRYGPLMLLHLGRVPVVVVSSAELAQEVMKTQDLKFANRPKTRATDIILNGGRDIASCSYDEYWRQMKSFCVVHMLGNKMVRSCKELREEEIRAMMEKLETASSSSLPVNISELLLDMTNNVISRIALGRTNSGEETAQDLKKLLRKTTSLLGVIRAGDYIPSLAWIDKIRGLDRNMEQISRTFVNFVEKVIQEHEDKGENNETPDFVDLLLSLQKEKKIGFEISRSDIRLTIMDIFMGGTSPTFNFFEWAMTCLLRNPGVMVKLKEEIRTFSKDKLYVSEEEIEKMKYLKAVVKEVMRVHIAAPLLIPRQVREDVQLKGYDIAAGSLVVINAWAIHRDTATWGPDAEEFKPERHLDSCLDFQGQDFKYIPFGSGRRLCPGLGFAVVLVEVTLANMVNRFDWKAEVGPQGVDDLTETTGIEVGRKFPLVAFPSSTLFTTSEV